MGTIREEVAKNIHYYRKRAGITQKELAKALGVSSAAVSNWEVGNNSIDIDTLFALCDYLHISINDIYGAPKSSSAPALSAHEREMVDAYRAHPEMQAAVDKLLGVEPEERADESAELVSAFTAAAKKSTPSG